MGRVSSASRGHGVCAYGRPAGETGKARRDRDVQPPPRREGETNTVRGGAQPAGLQGTARGQLLQEDAQGEASSFC